MTTSPKTVGLSSPHRNQVVCTRVNQATVLATGKDAVPFVDNFVTASVSSVAVGEGTEAFVTDGRGHVIALVTILRTEDRLEIVAPIGLGERLRDHLEHFHIREAVDLTDTGDRMAAILIAGPQATAVVKSLMPVSGSPPTSCLNHCATNIAGQTVRVVRVMGQGPDGLLVRGSSDVIDVVSQSLADLNVPLVSMHDLEAARIASGFPAASDIVDKTLPQELGRDARAISFTKGCYLGQETVARLDALGHVNRRLAILHIEADRPPTCPSPIHHGEHVVGMLTSSCIDTDRGIALGLAIVHAKALEATSLTIGASNARVLAVPPNRLE